MLVAEGAIDTAITVRQRLGMTAGIRGGPSKLNVRNAELSRPAAHRQRSFT